MSWLFEHNPSITGRVFGLPRLVVVVLWLGLMFAAMSFLDSCDRRNIPSESFAIYVLPRGNAWDLAPVGRGIPRHPRLPPDDTSDAIRCTITLESERLLCMTRGGAGTFLYSSTATIAVEPIGPHYTPEFCDSVVKAMRPQLARTAARTWPGRSLAPSIRSAGRARIVVVWSGLALGLIFLVMLCGLAILAIDGDRETRSGRWYSCREQP